MTELIGGYNTDTTNPTSGFKSATIIESAKGTNKIFLEVVVYNHIAYLYQIR